jgi:hypothetical protein
MIILHTVVALGFLASALALPAPTPAPTASSFSSAAQAAPVSGIIILAPVLRTLQLSLEVKHIPFLLEIWALDAKSE